MYEIQLEGINIRVLAPEFMDIGNPARIGLFLPNKHQSVLEGYIENPRTGEKVASANLAPIELHKPSRQINWGQFYAAEIEDVKLLPEGGYYYSIDLAGVDPGVIYFPLYINSSDEFKELGINNIADSANRLKKTYSSTMKKSLFNNVVENIFSDPSDFNWLYKGVDYLFNSDIEIPAGIKGITVRDYLADCILQAVIHVSARMIKYTGDINLKFLTRREDLIEGEITLFTPVPDGFSRNASDISFLTPLNYKVEEVDSYTRVARYQLPVQLLDF